MTLSSAFVSFATIACAWMIFFDFSPGVAAQYLISGGFPWYFAHASNKLNLICAHWALIPWLILAGGLIAFALNARHQNPNLRFVNLSAIEPTKNGE